MAEATKIEWCDHTFNPWRGCTKVSPGCANCYAEAMSGRNPGTLGVWGPGGTRVVASKAMWREPLKWNKWAEESERAWRESGGHPARKPDRPRVFCASLADVFEDWRGPLVDGKGNAVLLGHWEESLDRWNEPLTLDYFRFALFNLIRRTPSLDWLLLTKRPQNISRMYAEFLGAWDIPFQPNVWLGASVENQDTADERIPHLLAVPAAVRFLSVEPLLGPVDLTRITVPRNYGSYLLNAFTGEGRTYHNEPFTKFPGRVNWVIIGGESGPRARPCRVEWIRSLVRQCRSAGGACFVKQLGANYADAENGVCGKSTAWPFDVLPSGPTRRLSDPKGGDIDEFPADLCVRQFPAIER